MIVKDQYVENFPRPLKLEEYPLWLEKIGRVCYKSEEKISDGTAKNLLEMMWNKKHYSVFEHVHLVFEIDKKFITEDFKREFTPTCFIRLSKRDKEKTMLISGNIRAFSEFFEQYSKQYIITLIMLYIAKRLFSGINIYPADNELVKWLNNTDQEDLINKKLDEINLITDYNDLTDHEYLIHWAETTYWFTNRSVTHELVRHRINASYSQESQRYVAYNKSEMIFIRPKWSYEVSDSTLENFTALYLEWLGHMDKCQEIYNKMIDSGIVPQHARGVLPNDIKTELYCTMRMDAWKHFFELRTSVAAHPQIRELALKIKDFFIKLKDKN